MRRLRLVLVAMLGIACLGAGDPVGPQPPGGHRVPFVGNSLTYTNDLPRMLADLAMLGGDTIRTAAVALPNLALVDHAAGQSDAAPTIGRGRWEWVVMQPNPSPRGVNRDTLVIGAQALTTAIRADAALPLYGPDAFHPGPLGTWLAALVMYEHITGKDARALPATVTVAGQRLDVPAETARLLQRAAHETNAAYAEACER
jgi:hypothetical protein